MSTIVAVKRDNTVTLASDSLYFVGEMNVLPEMRVNNHKIYKVNRAYVALFGWASQDDIFESLIRNHADKLNFTNRTTIFESFRGIQPILTEEYFLRSHEDSDDQSTDSSQFDGLVISSQGIFGFSSFRNINEYTKFWATGSGKEFALGAMHTAYEAGKSTQEVAEAGIKAAAFFDKGSALPIQSVSMELGEIF